MYKITCLNNISEKGTDRLSAAKYEVGAEIGEAQGILVRSASMHHIDFSNNLLAIARAGAGVNNIPLEKCSDEGVVVFNTPGANANAVKELVLTGLLLSSRKIIESAQWVKTLKGEGENVPALVEKGKSQFTGPELQGKTIGVIGLGAIGVLVANAASSLGMRVLGFDPYLSVTAAWRLSRSIVPAKDINQIYANCDYITLHVPLTKGTKDLVNYDSIKLMKDGVRILNFSRGELVNSQAVKDAVQAGKVAAYATDFPDDDLLDVEGVIAIPHLGASTPESEDNCAVMAVDAMRDYLENGNISNSVNMPAISLGRLPGCKRVCVIHKNQPHTIATFATFFGEKNVNIENMLSKALGGYAYTILDVKGDIEQDHVDELVKMEPIIKVRVIV